VSTASRSNVRDDRETPLKWDGMAEIMEVIWVGREGIYFCKGGLDRWNQIDLPEEFPVLLSVPDAALFHFLTLLASILTDVSSSLVVNALSTANGFSMPR
jgi:hypothetical protein